MIYIVLEQLGEYEDFESNPIHAFTTEEAAKDHVKSLESRVDFIRRFFCKRQSLCDQWRHLNPLPQITDEDLLTKPQMSHIEKMTVSGNTASVFMKNEIHNRHNERIKEWKNKISREWQEKMDKEVDEATTKHFESEIKTFDFDLNKCLAGNDINIDASFDVVSVPLDKEIL